MGPLALAPSCQDDPKALWGAGSQGMLALAAPRMHQLSCLSALHMLPFYLELILSFSTCSALGLSFHTALPR